MRKKIFALMLILLVCFLAILLTPGKKALKTAIAPQDVSPQDVAPQDVVSEEIVVISEDEAEELYDLAYKKGYHAFMVQYDLEDPMVVYKYTSKIEEHEKNEINHEIIDKGYVDGYHKAAESGFCPR
jgi:uncharacterized membrane protein